MYGEGFVLDDLQTISASGTTLFTSPRQRPGCEVVTSETVIADRSRLADDLSPGKGDRMRSVLWITFRFVVCVVALTAVGACGQPSARSKALVNVDPHGIGALFTQRKATKGDSQRHRTYGGATDYFQLSADRDAFDGAPAKYAPQYSGYCVMAVTTGSWKASIPIIFSCM